MSYPIEGDAARLAAFVQAREQKAVNEYKAEHAKDLEKFVREGIKDALAKARAEAAAEALEMACRDVCIYCGNRANGGPAVGPNRSGNWTHINGSTLCAASAIRHRIRALVPSAREPAPPR